MKVYFYNNEAFDSLLKDHENSLVSNNDFIDKLLLFEENISNFDDERKFLVYLNLGKFLSIDGEEQDLENALTFSKIAESLIDKGNDHYRAELFHDQGHIYAQMKKFNESESSFLKYVKYLNRLSGTNIFTCPLYSFRSVNKYSKTDLENHEITIVNPVKFNDPFDTLLFNFIEYRRRKIKYSIQSLLSAFSYTKIRCFVMDDCDTKKDEIDWAFRNILMWSHYANSHKGICIRYKFDARHTNFISHYSNNNTSSKWLKVKYLSKVNFNDEGKEDSHLLFASKYECWNYEKEVRLVHFDPESKGKYKNIPLSELGLKIEAIFFGIKCTTRNKNLIKQKLEGKNVEFFDFKDDPLHTFKNIYKLELKDEERFNMLNRKD